MNKLYASEYDAEKLWELNAKVVDVQSLRDILELAVSVVVLDKVMQVFGIGEYLIVPEEVDDVLVSYSQVLLLVPLLVLNDEVVEENLVKTGHVLFDRYLNSLLSRLLIVSQAQLFRVLLLDDRPQLLK